MTIGPIEPSENVRLTASAWIPLGSAIAVALAVARGLVFCSDAYSRLVQMESRVAMVESQHRSADSTFTVGNRWTCTEHERWALQLKALNPNLRLPTSEKLCQP